MSDQRPPGSLPPDNQIAPMYEFEGTGDRVSGGETDPDIRWDEKLKHFPENVLPKKEQRIHLFHSLEELTSEKLRKGLEATKDIQPYLGTNSIPNIEGEELVMYDLAIYARRYRDIYTCTRIVADRTVNSRISFWILSDVQLPYTPSYVDYTNLSRFNFEPESRRTNVKLGMQDVKIKTKKGPIFATIPVDYLPSLEELTQERIRDKQKEGKTHQTMEPFPDINRERQIVMGEVAIPTSCRIFKKTSSGESLDLNAVIDDFKSIEQITEALMLDVAASLKIDSPEPESLGCISSRRCSTASVFDVRKS
jgi:hypothetical protein